MDLRTRKEIAARFNAYVDAVTKVIGHADRNEPLRDYCAGLLATEGRRSVEPMAAVTDPGRVSAQHQRLLHFVANAKWSDEQMLTKVRWPSLKTDLRNAGAEWVDEEVIVDRGLVTSRRPDDIPAYNGEMIKLFRSMRGKAQHAAA